MIIVRLNGGLGNQLFQYAIGRSIAEKLNDEFVVDLTDLKKSKFHYSLDKLCTSVREVSNYELMKTLLLPKNIYKVVFRLFGCGLGRYFIENERTVFDESVFNSKNIYLRGYWQNEEYFSNIRQQLLCELRMKDAFSDAFYSHCDDIERGESVALHVRRGDYLEHSDIGVLEPSYYLRALQHLKTLKDVTTVYVFSNDIDWCKLELDTAGLNTVYVDDTRDEYDDLFLMSKAKHNIIANSTFSWWAAWLNSNEEKVVISPLNWVKENPLSLKWVPDTWIQL